MRSVILAIDEGTTNVKALLLNKQGDVIGKGTASLSIRFPAVGVVEQDPFEIIEKMKASIALALDSVAENVTIEAVAISNQRESVVLWERSTGKPLTQVMSWQCRRSESLCDTLRQDQEFSRYVQESTGLVLDPMFPATKVSMALQQIPDGHARAEKGEICVGTINTWMIWNITQNVFVTDASNAARTQLYNIAQQVWDEGILARLGIASETLPEVVSSAQIVGRTKAFGALPSGVPIASQIGDSHAALFGHGGYNAGVVKATYGTGSSVMAAMPNLPSIRHEISTTIAWQDTRLFYGLEGNITHTGSAIDWTRRMLGVESIEAMCQLAGQADPHHSVFFVPALSGLGAPYWDLEATGIFCGLKSATERADIARSAFESVLFQVADVFNVISDELPEKIEYLCVDGGPTQNDWLMQAQADLLGVTIRRGDVAEVSAVGAGLLAGLAIGWWQTKDELARLENKFTLFPPRDTKHEYWQDRYQLWSLAVKKARLAF
ncbi:FGGY family carbohydrate kinase [Marinomonas posidonica]|uniref:ATP:glycerol 3-phosphotransferase n=1 Tax=Marinomonas posidonica (strain CECT 7376 / NCIMB 14433 / IVIA-Po-181) TaxID=491952 RepID=F6CU24_MARPP|nr:FGGY family carbohydrate kinase [Marinomonas posidonica]AEF54076.1 Glycerol kinase [Marinomonas posidonica IVIA-Po-181]